MTKQGPQWALSSEALILSATEEAMPNKKRATAGTVLPEKFNTLDEFWDFWDEHSNADYEEFMGPVEVEIALSSEKLYCAIAKDILIQVRTRARQQGVSTETLVNLWLQEKLAEFEPSAE